MRTVLEIINISTQFLQEKSIKRARKEACDLIAFCLKVQPLDLYLQFDRPLNEKELQACREVLRRRGRGEPFHYICGELEFFNCLIKVNPHVLIPRQETEILVDMIVKNLAKDQALLENKTLFDLCCGSGCIGIALKKALPMLDVCMSDISPEALSIAAHNAKQNHVAVTMRQADFLMALEGRPVDYLVCNPPYVSLAEFDALEVDVRGFEPKLALVADEQGLYFYKKLAQALPFLLQPQGKLWLEIGSSQGAAILELFSSVPQARMQLIQDWSGWDRFFFLEIE